MKRLSKLSLSKLGWLAFGCAVLVGALPAFAQTPAAGQGQIGKPVAILSVASIKENLADFGYLSRVAGMDDAGKSALFFASALTAGLDKERPIGMVIVPKGGDFHGIAFVPVSDLKVLLEVQKEYLGTPKDVGDGILEIGTDKKAFLKERAGWAFVSENKEMLADLPADPLTVLGDLPKNYNVAVKLIVQNVPVELRKMGIDQLKFGMERGLNVPGAGLDKKGGEQFAKMWLGNIERLMEELDELTIGIGINADKKHLILDVKVAAKEGTAQARQMAMQVGNKTQFGGLLLPDASVTFNASNRAAPEDLAQIGPAMKATREMWSKQIDDSPDVPADKRESYKRVLNQLIDVVEKTANTGKTDIAGAIMLLPKSVAFVAGAYVADGPGLEKVLKDAYALAKGRPNMPAVQFDAGSIGDVKLHRITAPVPDREPEARQLLGDKLEVLVGIGPQSVVVSGGKDAEALMKKVLEASATDTEHVVPPFQLNVSLLSILKFYRSVDNNPAVGPVLSQLEQSGNDRINISSVTGPRETATRIEIQEGLFQAAGGIFKAVGQGMQPKGKARRQ